MMRIITGVAKGIRLNTLEGENTRPTTERVKEAVFSMLQFDIEGRCVLDLFSGSGQLALEAVSRGASHAVMTDSSKEAVKIIKTNVQKTKLTDSCEVYNCEYKEYISKNKGKKFDLIFIDPPYSANLVIPSIQSLLSADMLKMTSLIVCETGNEDIFENSPALKEKFDIVKHMRYSKSYITIITPKKEEL